jgi:O-methyltransferase domain
LSLTPEQGGHHSAPCWPYLPTLTRLWEAQKAQCARTGESALSQVFGESLYEHLNHVPEVARMFDAEMIAISHDSAEALLAAYDFVPSSKIIDVGGGAGALLAAILQAHPHATGVIFERRMPERVTGPDWAFEADVSMLVITGGRQRTEA